ncbi:MAG TPA: 4a-hydroxytetrahydrobiopterin dehydratase [Paenibacillaceae bacterium]|nr:4a-hydroxytetrahydrobiopterin dehydratase [Paenibacillaceae bacterium]
MVRLSPEQIVYNLSKIPGWVLLQGERLIERTLTFADFKNAISFINQVSEFAELANHHPEMIINYNKVTLRLTTNDVNGLTGRDFALAQRINKLYPPYEKKR